ncbi:MAG: hypothetical protein BZY88_12495 [SAR202 cluster bacterium Io17-Chloro-G9]|nr:MAG: hypothetical protein BZY88_12495 [SAR202 cluster bacterium Io17-Chloro-G9]
MDIAIIGLPQSGKTTVFNALTGGLAVSDRGGGSAVQTHVGVVKVSDPRLDILAGMYQPEKVVPAEVTYWDLAAPEAGDRSQGIAGRDRNLLQGADAYLLVVRAFTNPAVPHALGSVDPGRDLATMLGELALADLEVLERAEDRLDDAMRKSVPAERQAQARPLEAIRQVRVAIEGGTPLRRQALSGSAAGYLADYQLLTAKPVVVAFNTDESEQAPSLDQMNLEPEQRAGLGEIGLCARLEADLALMPGDEQAEFRVELGLGEPATSRVVQVSYDTLGLVSFLTVGEDEVRAWSVPAGMPAQDAAGRIHSDFSRGFIRAEVIPYDDLVRCGSIAQARKAGVLRSEGKTYNVKDGDVINFLINV